MTPSKKEAWDGGPSGEVALLPCPFCRAVVERNPSGFVYHPYSNTEDCPLEDEYYAPENWNRRALPDKEALRLLIAEWYSDDIHSDPPLCEYDEDSDAEQIQHRVRCILTLLGGGK